MATTKTKGEKTKDNLSLRKENVRKYLEQLGGVKTLLDDQEIVERILSCVIETLGDDYDAGAKPGAYTCSITPVTDVDEEDEFEDFLCTRSDELENATHALLEEVAGKKLEWNIALIREVLEAAIKALSSVGIDVCNPFHGENETPCYLCEHMGGCQLMCWDCPMEEAAAKNRTFFRESTIVAKCEGESIVDFALIINVKYDSKIDLLAAFRDAAKEYCESPGGKEAAAKDFGDNFNYGDFVEYVPADICLKHGFVITSSQVATTLVTHGDCLIG